MNRERQTLLNLGVKSNEDRKEYQKRYNTYITCDCGCKIKKLTYYSHIKKPKHILMLELQQKEKLSIYNNE